MNREKELLNQIELLETELIDLKADIIRLYNTMMALESINKLELYKDVKKLKNDDIEEL